MSPDKGAPLPYADIAGAILESIYDGLYIIYDSRFRNLSEAAMIKRLSTRIARLRREQWAKHPLEPNAHILEGIPRWRKGAYFATTAGASTRVPRLARLCLEAADHAYRSASDTSDDLPTGIFLPSPLAILIDALTVPANPESVAYGFSLARAILFSHYRIHSPIQRLPSGWTELSLADAQDAVETFRIYAKHRDNIHFSKTNKPRIFLAHFLALQGIFVLRFGTKGRAKSSDVGEAQEDCRQFLKSRGFLTTNVNQEASYEFRLAPELIDIPDTQEILNSLMGVPVAIAGGATVFFGGIQRSHNDSVVVSVSGAPGTGKTSVALAMAASLAPFGTRCLYCSFEEDEETLRRRALSVVPAYFRRTTLLKASESDWLWPTVLDPSVVGDVGTFTSNYVSILKAKLIDLVRAARHSSEGLPAIAPLLVVIDSLTTLIGEGVEDQLDTLCGFVQELKALNCIVLLLSADEIPHESRLEYLVDMVIDLRHEGTHSAQAKPVRLFRLTKTRLQVSRPGAHILHLSGERGVRLSPQLPSQLDSHKTHRTLLANTSAFIDTLRPEKDLRRGSHRELGALRLVKLYPVSRIFIHGRGPAEKAPLALRLLMSSVNDIERERPVPFPKHKRPRILVVSFHYPTEYYDKVFARLKRIVPRQDPFVPNPDITVIALTPSFIAPEDFIAQVLLRLDEGHLEGSPYTGVLLDGLHNTFLQFPALQGNHMVWPALYSLLKRYELTVVTTFTYFTKTYSIGQSRNREDEEYILQGQLPFLHALVQATDFQLRVERRVDPLVRDRTFLITLDSALGQSLQRPALIWNGDRFSFDGWEGIDPDLGEAQLSGA